MVKSLAHPGGNITGVAMDTGPSIWGKRIALLREMVPSMTKLAFFGLSQSTLVRPVQVPAIEAAAAAQALALAVVPVVFPAAEANYRTAIQTALSQGADALMVGQNPGPTSTRLCLRSSRPLRGFPPSIPGARTSRPGGSWPIGRIWRT